MAKSKIRTIWVWDEEVAECFELWTDHPRKRTSERLMNGRACARYFEALRYRQQLTPSTSFVFRSDIIQKLSGLTYYQQAHARRVLEGCGWIAVQRTGRGLRFAITDLAREATKHIRHPLDKNLVRKRLALGR